MSRHRMKLGKAGEILAAEFLVGEGYRILEHNYRCSLGEIDIVAREKETLAFVEVKTRTSQGYGPPQLAITYRKRCQLTKVALHYLARKQISQQDCRFDIVSIDYKGGRDQPEIDLIRNAFSVEGWYL